MGNDAENMKWPAHLQDDLDNQHVISEVKLPSVAIYILAFHIHDRSFHILIVLV